MPETRHYCPHCEEKVSLSTLRRHKQLYFKEESHTWIKKSEVLSDSGGEDELGPVEEGGFYSSDESIYSDGPAEGICNQTNIDELEPEDQALLEQSVLCQSDFDEGDIDDGEFWGNVEESECVNDLPGSESSAVTVNPTFELADEQEEHNAVSIVKFLMLMIAKWYYRYSVTASALGALLKLIRLVLCTFSSFLKLVVSVLPSSIFTFKSFLDVKENDFVKYVVCPSCHSLYHFEDCFETFGQERRRPKDCSYIAFPHHPHRSRRQICGCRLLAEVTLKNGTKQYYPRKYYCYKSISDSLSAFAKRDGFLKSCELWRLRKSQPGVLCDIYDGQIWKDFQYINGSPFLAAPNNLALMLNIDWFRPYKHTPYSVGAIYVVITNLPRSDRFKKENIILVGIVPGPSEPPLHMNSYLKPLVDELNQLWQKGIQVTSPDLPHPVLLKAVLLCVACDIPACRKVLGFCGHMCKLGCSKCTKEFVYDRIAEKINFGNFSECPMRKEEDHRQQAFLAMEQVSASNRDKIEKQFGSRYSCLMELAYFDTVRCHVIDPMHNLFLGTAKHFTKNILFNSESPLIQKVDQPILQERVDKCLVPSTMGRIPHKIAASCTSFTADQWKAWTNVFSVFALYGLLEDDHFECWRLFVQASQMLSKPRITLEEAERGHQLLLQFCSRFEQLYGSERVTPNMHLHTHILNCIKDYGPIYSFWLFSFERYNGLLGGYRTNQRSVELQLMRTFLSDLHIYDLKGETNYASEEDLAFLLPTSGAGTLKEVSSNHSENYLQILNTSASILDPDFPTELWSFVDMYQLGGVMSTEILSEPELSCLAECYCSMYPGGEYSANNISSAVHKYSQVKVCNETYGSHNTRTTRSSYVLARWCGRNGRIDTTSLRPGRVSFYFKHSLLHHGFHKPHYFAFVMWFEEHPSRVLLGEPVEIWCHEIFEALGPASFLPMQRIYSKFVAGTDKIDEETMLFVMPLQQKIFL